MTRLRFLLVSFFAAVAVALGWKRQHEVRGLHCRTYQMAEVSNGLANRYREHMFTIMQKMTPEGMIYQWRTGDGIAMSPVFRCQDAAMRYEGPFVPLSAG